MTTPSLLRQFLKEDTLPAENPLEQTNAKINEEGQFKEECKSLLSTDSNDHENIFEIKIEPEFDSEEDVSSQTGPKVAIEYQSVSAIKYEVDLKTESVDPQENILENYQESDLISDVVKIEQDLDAYSVNLTSNEHQQLFKRNTNQESDLILDVVKTEQDLAAYSVNLTSNEHQNLFKRNTNQESDLISDVVKAEQDLDAYSINLTSNKHQTLFKRNIELKELLLLRKKQVMKTKTQINIYKQKNKSLSIVCDKLKSKMQERFLVLRKIFSLPQILTLFQMKESIVWTEKDWNSSAILKNINKECYSYIKHTLNYPLPDSPNTTNTIPNVIAEEPSLPNTPTSYK